MQYIDASALNNLAIISASRNGHFNVVNRLLEDLRVDPSDRNDRAIRWASENIHFDVVNRLLQDGRVNPKTS